MPYCFHFLHTCGLHNKYGGLDCNGDCRNMGGLEHVDDDAEGLGDDDDAVGLGNDDEIQGDDGEGMGGYAGAYENNSLVHKTEVLPPLHVFHSTSGRWGCNCTSRSMQTHDSLFEVCHHSIDARLG